MLEQPFHLKLQVQLQVAFVIDFAQQRQNGHRPRIRRFKDHVVFSRFEHLGDEGHDADHATGFVAFQNQLLEVQVTLKHGLTLRDGELTEPRAEILQQAALAAVRLDLTA